MNEIKKGIKQAVRVCMKINPKDRVVIVTDKKTNKIARYMEKECLDIAKNVKRFVLEEYGKRPLKKLPSEIEVAVRDSTAVFYMAQSMEGEKVSLRFPIINLAINHGRQAHMPDITEEIMEQGMNADYKKIKEVSKKVYDVVKNCKEIRIKTEKGTDFLVRFNRKWKWEVSDGNISKIGKWSNLPDGEVFTCPFDFNGKVVADGSIGDYFEDYNPLIKHPVLFEIKNCRVKCLKCENKELERKLLKYVKQDKNSDRVGEFAIGTNISLKKIIGNLLQDEKFPGIHFAVGDSYPDITGADFSSKAHCDFVILKTTIIVDGKMIMDKGRFVI